MRTGGVSTATFVLVFASFVLQVSSGDLYWEGEDDSNEFLEVKEEDTPGRLQRIKRDFFDWWSTPSTTTTESPANLEVDKDVGYDDELTSGKDDEVLEGEGEGSGYPDILDTELTEKTLRVTFVVMEPYHEEYSSRDSPVFQNFSKSLADAVNLLYEKLPGTQRASLVRIQTRLSDEFSCKVTLDIVTTGYEDTDRIADTLLDHIRTKRSLGNVKVSENDFSATVIDPETIDTCTEKELKCGDGICIPQSAWCDGKFDCSDRSDEKNCPSPTEASQISGIDEACAIGELTCGDGACVPGSARCDGKTDCADGIDEESCPPSDDVWDHQETDDTYQHQMTTESSRGDGVPLGGDEDDQEIEKPSEAGVNEPSQCAPDELICDDMRCISPLMKCDGNPDCYDGTDEADCPSACALDEITCGDGACVPGLARCDGKPDCADGKDEENCPRTESCGADDFTCNNGMCIARSSRCDGIIDCATEEDEQNCECRSGEFQCVSDYSCIEAWKRCDGYDHCKDSSDEQNCACSTDHWQCDHGSCIPRGKRCNGRVDCPTDRSDERNCFEYFRCRDGRLIHWNLRCNRAYDCSAGDLSDEQNCPCGDNDFECDNGYCIPASKRCDRTHDCQDRSDERNCTYGSVCMAYQYECSSGQCVPAESFCNGIVECNDGSDETNCPCKRGEFQCRDGSCINSALRCDGQMDCVLDGEDENDCERTCSPNEFTCPGSEGRCARRCDGNTECPGAEDELGCEECPHQCDGKCLDENQICDRVPDCSDGTDETNCDHCDRPDDFRCRDGDCINANQRCNGIPECNDGSDEDDATCLRSIPPNSLPCNEDEFQCQDGSCIQNQFLCDGQSDCTDHSDEKDCARFVPRPTGSSTTSTPCHESQFTCYDGRCIPHLRRCDNVYDCSDFSDEQNCLNSGCPIGYWRCPLGSCILNSKICDGENDCGNDEDEIDCSTSRPFIPAYPSSPRPPIYTTAEPPYTSPPSVVPDESECDRNEWRCENGPCISYNRRCDGHVDCPYDKSDELDCPPNRRGGLDLQTVPDAQSVRYGGDVVFQCRDKGLLRAPVRWIREDGRPLPPGSLDRRGRLEMNQVTSRASGVYICQAPKYLQYPDSQVRVTLTVDPAPVTQSPVQFCRPDEATCFTGECIPISAICDGKPDCFDNSDEDSCNVNGRCEPNMFQCDNKKCVLKTWLCDSENDCGDGSDERDCGYSEPGQPCLPSEFACETNDQCIPRSFHCDRQDDCMDRSDEKWCAPVTITKTPYPSHVILNTGETLVLKCEAVGVPIPLITWRLNWGHVPETCTTSSINGVGVLTCTDMQVQYNGAYSCEALNNKGSIFANQNAIVIVNQTGICRSGYFNSEALLESDCIRCFCFGESTQCKSADLFTFNMPTRLGEGGTRLVGVRQTYTGDIQLDTQPADQYYFQPLRNGATVTKLETYGARPSGAHPYLTLPETYNGNQLTSYGGHIKYKLAPHNQRYGYRDRLPDIVIKGKYQSLLYNDRSDHSRDSYIEARLTPGNWQKVGSNGLTPATREDIMMALDNIEMILLRAEVNGAGVNITEFVMESAHHIDTGLGTANLVEECTCPAGYEGLSCQKCAEGYIREKSGPWLGHCVREEKPCPPGTYGSPNSGYGCRPCPCPFTSPPNQFASTCHIGPAGGVICDCLPGYEGSNCDHCAPGYQGNPLMPGDSCQPQRPDNCNPAGTSYVLSSEECQCKENVEGRYCDECKEGSFYLSEDNRQGCAQCFCTGVSQQCTSSDRRRKTISVGFNVPQIVDQVRIYSSALTGLGGGVRYNAAVETSLRPTLQRGEAYLSQNDLSRPNIYYWSLPASFGGDKVTAYGGRIGYALRYVPTSSGQAKNTAPDIQLISENSLTFHYFGNFAPSGDGFLNVSARMIEKDWRQTNGKEVSREHFLLALADVKTILVKATYSINSQVASLVSASIDTAEPNGNGPAAVEVEQCTCPVGYVGTSCEDCAPGYRRTSSGLYLEHCGLCDCNGHSKMCHPETGVCFECADNTAGNNCELCKPGYERDDYQNCVPVEYRPCDCDERGIAVPCDDSGYCTCKQNVEGNTCDRCRAGTFGLDASNPNGCTACYCSGATTECHEASHFYRIPIPAPILGEDYGGYKLTYLNDDQVVNDQFVPATNESELMYIFSEPSRVGEDLYWSLPAFPGNRILSYGGNLVFTQTFQTGGYSRTAESRPTVVLVGDQESIYWSNPEDIVSRQPKVIKVPLQENGWYSLDTEGEVSRHAFMDVLKNLQRVLVKATLSSDITSTAIADVSMDTATDSAPGVSPAKGVEVCMCPEGHTGTSCETCTAGYYHDVQGYCRKCNCNGHNCQLGSGNQVVCNCRPPYTGSDCSTVGLVMELHPTISFDGDPLYRTVTFTCKYRAPEPLTVQFYFEGQPIIPPKLYNESRLHTDGWRGEHVWETIWDTKQQGQIYECHTITQKGFTLGVLTTSLPESGGESQNTPPPGTTVITVQITTPKFEIKEVGSSVNFTCQAQSRLTPRRLPVSWTRENGYLPQDRSQFDERTGMLIITNLQISDSGRYICRSSDGVNVAENIAVLQVPENPPRAPTVSITEPDREYYEGDRVELHCIASGNPSPTITWQKATNRALPLSGQVYETMFAIASVTEEDAGEYSCIASNSLGSNVATAVVNVRPRPGRDRLTVTPGASNVLEGQSTRLVCTGTANIPPGAIGWIRQDGAELESNVRADNGVLYVDIARLGNQGVYVCQTSTSGVVPVPVVLTVQPLTTPPPFEMPNITVSVDSLTIPSGDSGSVECTPQGYPLPLIKWKKYDGEFGPDARQRGNSLIISNAQESDRGYYVCEGLVEGDTTQIIYVYVDIESREVPQVEIWPKDDHIARLDGQYVMQCRVIKGTPEPVVTWDRNGNRQLSSFTQILPGNTLSFEKIEVNDEGEYTCTATNSAGSSSDTAVLKVRSEPEITITPSSYLEVGQGEPFNFECRANGYPQPLVSIKSRTDYREIVPPNLGIAAIRVSSATERDDGDYICTATNDAGSIDEDFTIRITRGDGGEGGSGWGDPFITDEPDIDTRPVPKTYIAVEGSKEAVIQCDTFDGSQVVWSRTNGEGLQWNAQQSGNSLIIRNPTKSDSGNYECTKYDSETGAQAITYTDLKVVTFRVSLRPPSQVVYPRQSPTVECVVEGEGVNNVFWKPLDKPFSSRVEARDSTLIFHEIELEDAGHYECFATSDYANASGIAEVLVNDVVSNLPKSHDHEQTAHVGATVHLNCNASQNVRIRWSKGGRTLPRSVRQKADGSLFIDYAQKSDSGRYDCHIQDNYGRKISNYINLHIVGGDDVGTTAEPASLVSLDESRRRYRVGDDVTVMCRVTTRSNRADWQKLGTNEYVDTRSSGDGAVLVILGVQEDDAGVYRCTGSDPYGATSYVDFTVEVVPEPTSPAYTNTNDVEVVSARLRQIVDLPCRHNMPGPVQFEWRKEYTPLSSEFRTDESQLHFDGITEADAGTYVCRVRSRLGNVEARIVLQVLGVVPRFQSYGYIAMPPMKDAFTQFDIEISFNPADENGLILYNSQYEGRSGDYMALQLVNGIPQFVMDTGPGPVVVNGDRPLQLNTWHIIRISRLSSKVTMDVDNKGPFTTPSEKFDVLELYKPLYIGGVPDYDQLPEQLSGATGFVGCVGMLILGREEKNIIVDSLEVKNVADCDSCAPNPCFNDGVCQEARNEQGYQCICKEGWGGAQCERAGEACRPGLCGPGKCQDTADGYKCLCPLSYTGTKYQNIEYPAFTGSAFLAIKAPKTLRTLRVSMKVKASSPVADGIIMYCAESPRGTGGFISLAVRDGKLEFRCDLGDGNGPAVVTAKRPLRANEWTDVTVRRISHDVSLRINTIEHVEAKLASSGENLQLDTPLFVGGVDDSVTLNPNTGVSGGFSGCITDVKVYNNPVNLINSSIISSNVQECTNYESRGDIPELETICKQCRNGGRCLRPDSTECTCPSGYSGLYCEHNVVTNPCAARPCRNGATCRSDRRMRERYSCDCPLGWTGTTCQNRLELLQSVGFEGNGYLELPAGLLRYDQLYSDPALIALAINTRDSNGVLFYQRHQNDDPTAGDYLLLRVNDGIVTMDWKMGGSLSTVSIENVYVNDGEQHPIYAKIFYDYSMSLSVDGYVRNATSTGYVPSITGESNIYIGGMPDVYNENRYPGLTGCFEQVELMDHNRGLDLGKVAVTARNAQRCR